MPTQFPELWTALAAPFSDKEVKVRSQGKKELRYITARTAANRLDSVLGPENWWDDYQPAEHSVICRLTVQLPDGSALTKADAGGFAGMDSVEDNEKSGYSDAFKRACAKFGVGRYLYGDGVPTFTRSIPPRTARQEEMVAEAKRTFDDPDAFESWLEDLCRKMSLDYGDAMTRIEQWGIKNGYVGSVRDWYPNQRLVAAGKLQDAIRAGKYPPPSEPDGPDDDGEVDPNTGSPEDPGDVGEVMATAEPRKPALEQKPSPPKPGRVYSWLDAIQTKSNVQIRQPWQHQLHTVLRGEIDPKKRIDDYNDREREILYKFALFCLGFPEEKADAPAGQSDSPAAPARTVFEWRSLLLDLADRLIKARSLAHDEEPIRVVSKQMLDGVFINQARAAMKVLKRPPPDGPPDFRVESSDDWALMAEMAKALKLQVDEWEGEIAKKKAEVAAAKVAGRQKGGKRAAG